MKILYVTTISNTVNAFLIPHIKMLIDNGHKVDVAFNIEQDVKEEIYTMGSNIYDVDFKRSPFKNNYKALVNQIKNIILKGNYDLVHTHTPIASAIVRFACRNLDNVKVIYTAHGFHFYQGAPLTNWLLYYPVERWLSRYTDTLITINQEDYNRAKKFKKTNTVYVPGVGLDLEEIRNTNVDRNRKREELGIPKESFLITSVGELNANKNHEVVIQALSKLENKNIHFILCGQGPLYNYLIELSKKNGIKEQVHLLGFRTDVHEINKASDLFVFPSYREGLPVSLMEAMAAGLPVVASDIRGSKDLIVDGEGGYLLPPENINGWSKAINDIYDSTESERKKMGDYNQLKSNDYDLKNVTSHMKRIYE